VIYNFDIEVTFLGN